MKWNRTLNLKRETIDEDDQRVFLFSTGLFMIGTSACVEYLASRIAST